MALGRMVGSILGFLWVALDALRKTLHRFEEPRLLLPACEGDAGLFQEPAIQRAAARLHRVRVARAGAARGQVFEDALAEPHQVLAFGERQVERVILEPGRNLLGIHTVNRAGDLTVIDAFTRRSRFALGQMR